LRAASLVQTCPPTTDALVLATDGTVVSFSAANVTVAYKPTNQPTPAPTVAPTPLPTRCFDAGPFCEVVVPADETAAAAYCSKWFCNNCSFANDCDLT
jgi:hypothetical protein